MRREVAAATSRKSFKISGPAPPPTPGRIGRFQHGGKTKQDPVLRVASPAAAPRALQPGNIPAPFQLGTARKAAESSRRGAFGETPNTRRIGCGPWAPNSTGRHGAA